MVLVGKVYFFQFQYLSLPLKGGGFTSTPINLRVVYMKNLLLVLSLFSFSAMASEVCADKVLNDYMKAVPANEQHALTGEVLKLEKGEKSFKAYGVVVEVNYNFATEVYFASSEYMGGYGVEALVVDPRNCETLKMENVYTE